jgi:hypothetical protein
MALNRVRKNYINIIANSDPASGSINLNSTGNQFSLQFNPPILIPQNAFNIRCYLRSANIWYSFLNINSTNNKVFFTDDTSDQDKYELTLQNGLYSLDLLNSAVQREVQNLITLSGYSFPSTLINLIADEASQKVVVNISVSGYQVNWLAGSPNDLLGITLNTRMPAGSNRSQGSEFYYANTVANFSNLTDLTLQTSITNTYVYNGRASSVIDVVPIDVSPNTLITYRPQPDFTYVEAGNLQGACISQITFTLTDQNLQTVNTNSEYFNLAMTIDYDTFA